MQLSDMDPFTELTLIALAFTLVLFASCVLLYHCLIWIGEICDIILNIVIRAVPGPHFGISAGASGRLHTASGRTGNRAGGLTINSSTHINSVSVFC